MLLLLLCALSEFRTQSTLVYNMISNAVISICYCVHLWKFI